MGGGGAPATGMFAEPVPFNRVSFSYLRANGQARNSCGSATRQRESRLQPHAVVNISQLMRARVPGPLGPAAW